MVVEVLEELGVLSGAVDGVDVTELSSELTDGSSVDEGDVAVLSDELAGCSSVDEGDDGVTDDVNEEVCEALSASDEEGAGFLQAHSVIAITKQSIVAHIAFTFTNFFIKTSPYF